MNRYKKANEGIHAPEELKQSVIRQKRTSYAKWISTVAAVLVVAIVAGIVFWPGNTPVARAAAIAEAAYPEMPQCPNIEDYYNALTGQEDWEKYGEAHSAWWDEVRARRDMAPDWDALQDFYAATIPEFLGDSQGENLVYSPLNVYMALAMLAETCDGTSRQQILDLLGVSDIEDVRDLAYRLWNSSYRDDGVSTTIPASSLWLNEDIPFVQSTMNRLADTYCASSYQGEMGSKEFNAALRDWLNQQTGGLLSDYAANVELDTNTVLAIATTLYFKAVWNDKFLPQNNVRQTFHGAQDDVTAEFMRQSSNGTYYWGDTFAACSMHFEAGGTMWFLLPDEGVSVDELLTNGAATEFLAARGDWENEKFLTINFSMPKFDVSSQIDLIEGLQNLGITDVFDGNLSDFTPMTTAMEGIFVNQATHAARVVVDEEGVEAAAFTIMGECGALPPSDEVDFVLDRPFLFAITNNSGQLLFVGVVNQV